MSGRFMLEANINDKNDPFGSQIKTWYGRYDGHKTLQQIRTNLKTAKNAAGVLKKLNNYTKKGVIRPDGRTKLTPQQCWPFIGYILRVNLIDDSFELEPIYETISDREFAYASKRSTSTFVK